MIEPLLTTNPLNTEKTGPQVQIEEPTTINSDELQAGKEQAAFAYMTQLASHKQQLWGSVYSESARGLRNPNSPQALDGQDHSLTMQNRYGVVLSVIRDIQEGRVPQSRSNVVSAYVTIADEFQSAQLVLQESQIQPEVSSERITELRQQQNDIALTALLVRERGLNDSEKAGLSALVLTEKVSRLLEEMKDNILNRIG